MFAIEPVVGTETAIAPQPAGTSASLTSSPAAAASPTGFYVAWLDSAHPVGDPRLVGMRVSRTGEALDGFGVTLAAHATASDVRVSWNGNDYAVVSGAQHWLISPAGAVRGPFGNPPPGITVRSARGETVIVESIGSTKLTYIDNGVRTDSVTLSGSALTIHVVQPVENDWVVFAEDQAGTLRWFRVNRTAVISSNVINANPLQRSIAASPSDIVITWTTRRPLSPNQDLVDFGQTVVDIRSGAFRDEIFDSTVVPTGASPWRTPPFVFFDGKDFVYVTTHVENDQYVIRMRSAGVLRTVATSDSRHPLTAAVVGSGGANLLVWQLTQPRADRSGAALLSRAFERVTDLDQPRTPVVLSRAPATQLHPRAAVGAAGMFTAWREISDAGRIVGRFLPTAGAAGARIDLPGAGEADALAVAANVDTYLLAWRELDLLPLSNGSAFVPLRLRIKVSRFDANGVALDPAPILIVDHTAPAEGFGRSGVSAVDDGASFVIAWTGEFGKLHLTRIPSRGPVFASVRILDELPEAGPVVVRPNNGGLTLFWTTNVLKGALLRSNLVPETPLTLVDEEGVLFDAAAKDSELLLAWSRAGGCINSRRFTLGLNAIEPARNLRCDGTPYLPATTWDGARWWVAAAGTNAEQPLRGWRLFLDGSPEPPVTIVPAAQRPLDPQLVRTPAGLSAIYARLDEASSFTWHGFIRPIIVKSRGRAVRH